MTTIVPWIMVGASGMLAIDRILDRRLGVAIGYVGFCAFFLTLALSAH